MPKNMGLIDKIARVALAGVVIALYFAGTITGTAAIILLVFAGVFIATSLMGSCPLYIPFNISTLKKEK
jgi:K+-transporting ATPase A subunit